MGRRVVLVPEGPVPFAGFQHAPTIQRWAEHEPLRDAGFAVRPRQAPHNQWMVDRTSHDGEASDACATPDRRSRSADRDLLTDGAHAERSM